MPGGEHRSVSGVVARHGYEKVRTVGEGSFGKVVLVRRAAEQGGKAKQSGMTVVKLIDLSRAARRERDEALAESRLLSQLKHPFIVKYRDQFLDDGWLGIAMAYCEGGDLSSRIRKARENDETFPERLVHRWFTQALLALQHVHGMQIIHRDVKPGNFFLSGNDNLKLGDFGVSKVLDCTSACAQTQIGTPYFMSPEICLGKPYTWTSDIWAMGCVLFEMCARRHAFEGHSYAGLLHHITKAKLPEFPAQYAPTFESVFREMMDRDANARPQADDILELPQFREKAAKMMAKCSEDSEQCVSRESSGSPRDVVAPAAEELQIPLGCYECTAGSYFEGDPVEYYSDTHGEWLPARVLNVDLEGRIIVDLKPNTWLPVEVQAVRVRIALPEIPDDDASVDPEPQQYPRQQQLESARQRPQPQGVVRGPLSDCAKGQPDGRRPSKLGCVERRVHSRRHSDDVGRHASEQRPAGMVSRQKSWCRDAGPHVRPCRSAAAAAGA